MKFFMNLIILFLMSIFQYEVFAQNYLIDKPNFTTEKLHAPGVDRVGVVPLPVQNYNTLPVSELNSQLENKVYGSKRKEEFESTYTNGRSIYLNGENINSVRNQDLENVNIHIDKHGNMYVVAPQYEVNSDQSYHPLLPDELPKFSKDNIYDQLPVNSGVYSKQSGQAAQNIKNNENDELKDLPEDKIPPIASDSTQKSNKDKVN